MSLCFDLECSYVIGCLWYHPVLPWNCDGWRVAPVPQGFLSFFPSPWSIVLACTCRGHLSCYDLFLPVFWNQTMIKIFVIHCLVLETWVADYHKVMKNQACLDDEPSGGGAKMHSAEKNLKAVGQNTEGILYDSPCPRESVDEESLFLWQTPWL